MIPSATLLSDLGAGTVTNAISALRATLSGEADDQGTLLQATGYTNAYNFVTNDINGLTFRRTTMCRYYFMLLLAAGCLIRHNQAAY